jgi:hypothetical protein
MTENSVGNVTEILDLLDAKTYNAEQLVENYKMLVGKWGEWELVGAGNAGLVIRYVNVGNALFSGLMVTYCTCTIIMFVIAILFGKIVFPLFSKYYLNRNDTMVDLATLKSADQIEQMKKEWF